MNATSSVAYVAAASSATYSEGRAILAITVASVVVDSAGREIARAARYFANEVTVSSVSAPATAQVGESVAVWLATLIAPADGALVVRTRSERAATVLARRHADSTYAVLESQVRAHLEYRGARLEYSVASDDATQALVESWARAELARGDAVGPVPEGDRS